MKVTFEIDATKIELPVSEALDVLHKAISEEAIRYGGCPSKCKDYPNFICSRGRGHNGSHIATGSEAVYDIWKD